MLGFANLLLLMAILAATLLPAGATTAPATIFAGVQSTVTTTGLNAPSAVAVDTAGNLYIADAGSNRVLKITPAGVQSTILSGSAQAGYVREANQGATPGVNSPAAIAVDTSGNIFVADTGNNRVIEVTAKGVVSTVASGLSHPQGVAVDGSGNVFISDTGNNQILQISAGTKTTLISSSTQINGVALAKPTGLSVATNCSTCSDEIYIADTGNNRVFSGSVNNSSFGYDWMVSSGLSKPVSVVPGVSNFRQNGLYYGPVYYIAQTEVYNPPTPNVLIESSYNSSNQHIAPVVTGVTVAGGMAMDNAGNLYIADTGNSRIVKLATFPTFDFGTVSLGATSAAATFNFAFTAATTMQMPFVVTQGATAVNSPGLDFQHATSTSTSCEDPWIVYPGDAICTVPVQMKPLATRERMGAIVASDSSGDTINVYLHGIGAGPQIAYDPGVQTTLATGLVDPRGVAVDGYGNVYIADFGNGQIVKVTPAGAKSTLATIDSPASLAIDGAGNLYAAGAYEGSWGESIIEVSRSGTVSLVTGNYDDPLGIAVDGAGDIFEADIQDNAVEETPPAGNSWPTFNPGFTPSAVAVDSLGNLYMVDRDNWLVWKYTPAGDWSTIGSGYNRPQGVAVDQAGNVFVADFGNDRVVKVTPAGVQSTVGTGLIEPTAVTVDGLGNIYIADFGNSRVVKIDRSTPPSLSFASTAVGKTSSDSPKELAIENIGNAALAFPVPSTGTNASLSAGFKFGSATTCPEIAKALSAASLPAGSECIYQVSFSPTAKGTVTGSLVMTDNNLNVTKATQTIDLTGAATAATAAVKLSNLSQTYTGTPVEVAASSSPSGLKVALTYNGKTTAPTAAGSYAVVGKVSDANYQGQATGTLVIAKAKPVITWATPKPLPYGSALTSNQLDAKAKVAGKFTYNPPSGTIPAQGTVKLTVTFTPTDSVDYSKNTASVVLVVN